MERQDDLTAFLESLAHTGIYVIDQKTYQVYYENTTARKVTGKDRIGEPCYLVHGNQSMCASCPLRREDRKTLVTREDLGMIFSVTASDSIWRGIPVYVIRVAKERDIAVRRSLSEASLERMNRALHSSIISYVDINMASEKCQAIHFDADGDHNVYEMPYEAYQKDICYKDYVFEEDQERGDQILGIENLRALSADSEGPTETSVQFRIRDKRGQEHDLESTAYILRDELPHHISIVAKEITQEVKKLEKVNQKLTLALARAEQATKDRTELFARMSHDMRTPMNGILGMAELSKTETNVEVLQRNMRLIDSSGKYMLRMINDTLDMKRIENGNLVLYPQVFNCHQFIEGIREMVYPDAKENKLHFRVRNKNIGLNCYGRCDGTRLKQIFMNLISNAIKYSKEGGTVEFTLECLKHEDGYDYDKFEVRDTGIGIGKEFLEHGLFEPYAQEKNEMTGKYAGPGLGLAITKSLVELMGGRIEVESEPGEGTTFTVYLRIETVDRRLADEILNKRKNYMEEAKRTLHGKHILLCEDHPLNAEISKRLLERVGCQVEWAQDGVDGLERYKTSHLYEFDAILMDIQMPRMDGLEATRKMRSLERADAKIVPIIAMTANAFEEDKEDSRKAGMNAHLAKPVVPNVMYQTLEKFLGDEDTI